MAHSLVKFGWSAWLGTLVLVAVVATSLGGLVVPAEAVTKMTITGSVACQSGATNVGVYVKSSAGGSGWATTSNRSGAAWIRDYSYTISSSSSTTSVEVHSGCGGSGSSWSSSNKFKVGTVSASRSVNLLCNDKSGVTAYSCRGWSAAQVLIGMPFTGRLNGDANTHSKYSGHDVAEDVYAVPGTVAKVWAFGVRGQSISLRAESYRTGVCGGVNVAVSRGGTVVGRVHFGHLNSYSSAVTARGALSNGATLGKTYQWAYKAFDGTCGWLVNNSSGVHTHMALTSVNAWACIADYAGTRSSGRWIGMVGTSPARAAKALCPLS